MKYVHINHAAFSEEEMLYYDQYWDAIRIEKAALDELTAENKKLLANYAEVQRLKEKPILKLARKMKKYGESNEEITRETGLSSEEIKKL